jgi:hypothetical protein
VFEHANGTVQAVSDYGLLAYYMFNSPTLEPFPNNFRFIAGNNTRRTFSLQLPIPLYAARGPEYKTQEALSEMAIGFNCLNYERPPEPSLGRNFLPDRAFIDENCKDGIRLELAFPTCWNGKFTDNGKNQSPNVLYPDQVINGVCPDTHPKRFPTLFYEIITTPWEFKGLPGKLLLSNNDATGRCYVQDSLSFG